MKHNIQTLQWVQETEKVEGNVGQVTEREEDQAPGNAEQSADTQQGKNCLLGVFVAKLSKNKMTQDTAD